MVLIGKKFRDWNNRYLQEDQKKYQRNELNVSRQGGLWLHQIFIMIDRNKNETSRK